MTGLSGVIAYSVLLRRREIGIRLALGADPRDVVSLIMKQGLLLTSAGMIIGLGLAFGLTKFLTSQIPGVRAFDLIVYAVVAGLIYILSLLATYFPARRASRTNPALVLKQR